MDKIIIPGSITLERSIATQKYNWKSDKKRISVYKRPYKRMAIRFMCKKFAYGINKLEKDKRQVLIKFIDDSNVSLKRIKNKGVSLQGYAGNHPYIQAIVNKVVPRNLKNIFEKSDKKTLTLPINIQIDLEEWKNIKIAPDDFLLEVEKDAKLLMKKALKKGFKVNLISKGRVYDLGLISPNKKEMVIAISSHVAKNNSRSKEKTIQKILMDISKMLPYLEDNKKTIPIIISRPIDFKGSWSFSTDKYLNFYKDKFGFKFITTEFKYGWEDNIIKELLKI
ncbi:MAG: hypothetical protein ABIH37_00445 [archaeon]